MWTESRKGPGWGGALPGGAKDEVGELHILSLSGTAGWLVRRAGGRGAGVQPGE